MQANLVEVMSSIQGEGLVVGHRQLFIRFAGCNLACAYCDTRNSFDITKQWRLEMPPGSGNWEFFTNPVNVQSLLLQINRFSPQLHHSISLTGGEPLLHTNFLTGFLPEVRALGWRVYLETNGTLVQELRKIIHLIDIVAMDIKIESASGEQTNWENHLAFLKVAADKKTFIKVVVNKKTTDQEIEKIGRFAQGTSQSIEIVLQPQTGAELPLANQWLNWHELLSKSFREVRIIPQTHKILGVL